MDHVNDDKKTLGPKQPEKRHPQDEGVEGPPELVESEPEDIEEENSREENESIEGEEPDDDDIPPVFQE